MALFKSPYPSEKYAEILEINWSDDPNSYGEEDMKGL